MPTATRKQTTPQPLLSISLSVERGKWTWYVVDLAQRPSRGEYDWCKATDGPYDTIQEAATDAEEALRRLETDQRRFEVR